MTPDDGQLTDAEFRSQMAELRAIPAQRPKLPEEQARIDEWRRRDEKRKTDHEAMYADFMESNRRQSADRAALWSMLNRPVACDRTDVVDLDGAHTEPDPQPAADAGEGRHTSTPLLREVIGAVVRDARRSQARTLRDISKASRGLVSIGYLSEVERGRKDPSSLMFQRITEALGLSLASILKAAADQATPHRRRSQTTTATTTRGRTR